MRIEKYEELPEKLRGHLLKANVFFQKEFVNYVRSNGEELYYVYDDERIMPVRHRRKYIFNFGVLVTEPFELKEKPEMELSLFLNTALEMLTRKFHIQWANTTASGFFAGTPSKKCKRIPFGRHVVDLTKTEEELWKGVHSKHRNVIRKAEKENVVIRKGSGEWIDAYVKLESETSHRTGRSASGKAYYARQIQAMADKIIIYIADKEDTPQAGGIFYYNERCCYYMYGATGKNAVNGSANELIWRVMLDMKKSGVEEFSFVGCRINEDTDSKYHGIQKFKERFGGDLRKGYMFRYENKPYMYHLFCKMMQYRTHKKTIYKDPIDEEIHKWKSMQI